MPKHRPQVYPCSAVVHGTLLAGPPLPGTDASKCMLALLDISPQAAPIERPNVDTVVRMCTPVRQLRGAVGIGKMQRNVCGAEVGDKAYTCIALHVAAKSSGSQCNMVIRA
jgi:hypothetical protein